MQLIVVLVYHFVMDVRLRLLRWLRASGVGFLCWFLVGCQYDPWADRFLKNRPAETDLVGTYRVDADTLARRISIPWSKKTISISRDAEITLYADHKAQFLHVPELDVFTRQECVISGTGLWQLGRNDHYVDVAVQIQRTDYHQSVDGCQPTHNGELMLYGSKPPYKLHITIGDPDAGDAMQFEKAN